MIEKKPLVPIQLHNELLYHHTHTYQLQLAVKLIIKRRPFSFASQAFACFAFQHEILLFLVLINIMFPLFVNGRKCIHRYNVATGVALPVNTL